jgi:hypothetical protein
MKFNFFFCRGRFQTSLLAKGIMITKLCIYHHDSYYLGVEIIEKLSAFLI